MFVARSMIFQRMFAGVVIPVHVDQVVLPRDPAGGGVATGLLRTAVVRVGRMDLGAAPITSVYLTDNEWVSELANRTVHPVMHIGWVPDETGGYRGQMAILVKPNGLFGRA